MARFVPRHRFRASDVASLVLRLSLSMTLAILSLSADSSSMLLSAAAAVLGCLVGAGCFTRVAAAASVVLIAVSDQDDLVELVPIAASACSLGLIGAGAFSLDALGAQRQVSTWRNV